MKWFFLLVGFFLRVVVVFPLAVFMLCFIEASSAAHRFRAKYAGLIMKINKL